MSYPRYRNAIDPGSCCLISALEWTWFNLNQTHFNPAGLATTTQIAGLTGQIKRASDRRSGGLPLFHDAADLFVFQLW
jgi:hypothetical protein